jgi:hypothetical protein
MVLPVAFPLAPFLMRAGITALGAGAAGEGIKSLQNINPDVAEQAFLRTIIGPISDIFNRTTDTPSGKVFAPTGEVIEQNQIPGIAPPEQQQGITGLPIPEQQQGITGLPIPEKAPGLPGLINPEQVDTSILNKEDTSYRAQHQPRGPETEDSVRLDDLTKSITGEKAGYPDDFYSDRGQRLYAPGPRFKDDEYGMANQESFQIINKVKNKPDEEVTIYRAVPKDDKIKDINEGDFVTLSKKYAELHGAGGYGRDGKDAGKILEKKVKVKDIYWDQNDVNEFGYFPTNEEKTTAKPVKQSLTEVSTSPTEPFDVTDTSTVDFFPFNPVDFKKNGILNNPEIIKAFDDLKNDVKIKPPVGFDEDYMALQQSDSFYLTPPRAQMEIALRYLEKQLEENKASEETLNLIKNLNKDLQSKIKDTGYYAENKKVEDRITNLPGMTNKLKKLKSSN